MHPRWVSGLVVALLSLAVPVPARAWQEVHELSQDAYVRVDPDGMASIEDKVRWRVVHGPLKSIDLANVDEKAAIEPRVTVSTEDGRALLAHLDRKDERTLRVTIDELHPPLRGVLTFDLHWRVDLGASRALVRDSATYRLTWSAPAAVDGLDGARTVFDFPAAPDPPQPIVADTGLVDDGAVASVRRDPGRDVLELVAPHVARGGSAEWTVRVDPRSLAMAAAAPVGPPGGERWPREPDRVRETSLLAALALLALSFGLLVVAKTRAFASACRGAGVRARALLPLATAPRAVLAGVALAGGVALQVTDRPTLGGLFVALAALASALRAPAPTTVVRGPGRWLALRPSEAFGSSGPSGHWLDAGTRAGRITLLLVCAVAAGLARLASRFAVESAWLFAMDGSVFIALLVTGCASQLPPNGRGAFAPWLARVFRNLRGVAGLRAAPWGRLALDGAIDEVRILVLPRAAVPGVVGIEVGQAWSSTPVGWAPIPELLVRVLEGSAACARLAQVTTQLKVAAVVGRRPDERVVRLAPRAPTVASAVALARMLAGELADRRVAVAVSGAAPRSTPDGKDRRRRPVLPPDVLEPRVSVHGS